jgi:hypothetical protein
VSGAVAMGVPPTPKSAAGGQRLQGIGGRCPRAGCKGPARWYFGPGGGATEIGPGPREGAPASRAGAKRDPPFRRRVLTASGGRCAVCGFDVRLGPVPVAPGAAHIRCHQAGGRTRRATGWRCACCTTGCSTAARSPRTAGAAGSSPECPFAVAPDSADLPRRLGGWAPRNTPLGPARPARRADGLRGPARGRRGRGRQKSIFEYTFRVPAPAGGPRRSPVGRGPVSPAPGRPRPAPARAGPPGRPAAPDADAGPG